MMALALAFCLAAAAGPGDTDLPRSLSDNEARYLLPVPAAEPVLAKDDFALWAGIHLGVAGAYDARTRWSRAALRSCPRGGGCFPPSRSRKTS